MKRAKKYLKENSKSFEKAIEIAYHEGCLSELVRFYQGDKMYYPDDESIEKSIETSQTSINALIGEEVEVFGGTEDVSWDELLERVKKKYAES